MRVNINNLIDCDSCDFDLVVDGLGEGGKEQSFWGIAGVILRFRSSNELWLLQG